MPKMVAYCGLICSNCPTYLATKNDDEELRKKTADLYGLKYGLNLKPVEINCEGCLSVGGKLIIYCQNCSIRKCCSQKGFDNCASCSELPCDHIIEFHRFSPEAKASLDDFLNQ